MSKNWRLLRVIMVWSQWCLGKIGPAAKERCKERGCSAAEVSGEDIVAVQTLGRIGQVWRGSGWEEKGFGTSWWHYGCSLYWLKVGMESTVRYKAGWLSDWAKGPLMVMGSYYPEDRRRKLCVRVCKVKRIEFSIVFGILEGYPVKKNIR